MEHLTCQWNIVAILAPVNRPNWTHLLPYSAVIRPMTSRGPAVKWKVAFSILALSIATQASADEHRGGDAALGALSGAVVLGPIGAVAGAVVGYTAGPSIAHAWGFRRSAAARQHTRPAKQDAQAAASPAQAKPTVAAAPATPQAAQATPTAAATPQTRPAAKTASSGLPPVQTLE
jgi:predicted lipid-binding transport protein (Tim44 family)